jgi:hypothetical protein
MANHVLHERHDRYELSDVQETKILHMRNGQQTHHAKNEKPKVRVCSVLRLVRSVRVER